jgi:Mg2+ and Co2+ transporter CorA
MDMLVTISIIAAYLCLAVKQFGVYGVNVDGTLVWQSWYFVCVILAKLEG